MRVGRARRRREARAGRVEPARGGKRLLLVLSDAVFGDHAHDGRVDGRQGGSVARLPRRAGRKKVEKAGSSWRLGRGVTQRAGEGGGGAVKRRPVELVAPAVDCAGRKLVESTEQEAEERERASRVGEQRFPREGRQSGPNVEKERSDSQWRRAAGCTFVEQWLTFHTVSNGKTERRARHFWSRRNVSGAANQPTSQQHAHTHAARSGCCSRHDTSHLSARGPVLLSIDHRERVVDLNRGRPRGKGRRGGKRSSARCAQAAEGRVVESRWSGVATSSTA